MDTIDAQRYPEWNARGFTRPLPGVSLVWLEAARGVLTCGAFDVQALGRFQLAAAKVRRADGRPIGTTDDLLEGAVVELNPPAEALGLRIGMSAREAAAQLSA